MATNISKNPVASTENSAKNVPILICLRFSHLHLIYIYSHWPLVPTKKTKKCLQEKFFCPNNHLLQEFIYLCGMKAMQNVARATHQTSHV